MSQALSNDFVLSERDFRKISGLVYKHCGINLHDGKKELVRTRLIKLLRKGNFATFNGYIEYVLSDKSGKEFARLIDVLTTNLTSFFREKQHFEFLSTDFLPSLLRKKGQNGDYRIRAWSAGCSSGEEPYSIAITLLEAINGLGRWDTKVLATDISSTMLETARTGIYSKERIAPVPALQKNSYLTLRYIDGEKLFEVNKSLRNIIIFKHLNLMADWPVTGPIDFIFCRNVMIYFDKATQTRLVNRYWNILNSGGILFTGHSESLTGIEHKFKYVQPTIYAKP